MIFVDCILQNCSFYTTKNDPAFVRPNEHYYKEIIKDRQFFVQNVLIIRGGHMINCFLNGEYEYIEFDPVYCKDVKIGDFVFADGLIRFNCKVWGGIMMEENVNKFIAGMLLVNDDLKYVKISKIKKWKKKLSKFFLRRETCQK